jgi:hypothetical protein
MLANDKQQERSGYLAGYKNHSHYLNPDPFSFEVKRPGFFEALARATVHRGSATYSTSLKMLRKEDIKVLRPIKADREGDTY